MRERRDTLDLDIGARVPGTLRERRPAVSGYFPALDGLRFFCAALVVLAHSFNEAAIIADVHHPLHAFVSTIGRTSVDVFFSLSGFLITKLLLDEREKGRVDLKAFYVRRGLRIWPVYYFSLFLAFGGSFFLGSLYLDRFGGAYPKLYSVSLPAHLFFVGNFVPLSASPMSILVLWSVCVEEQFYLIFPVLFVFSRRRAPVFAVVGVLLSLAWAFRVYLGATSDASHIIYNLFARPDNLLFGAVLAQLLQAWPTETSAFFRRLGGWGELAAILGVLTLNQCEVTKIATPLAWLLFYVASGCLTTLLVGVFALGEGPVAQYLKGKRIRFLGQLTYACYCLHIYAVVAAWILVKHIPLAVGPWTAATLRTVLAIPLALVIAYAVRVTFEKRLLDLKRYYEPEYRRARAVRPEGRLVESVREAKVLADPRV